MMSIKQLITVVGSGHFGYRNVISDFRTLLIILAINSFHDIWCKQNADYKSVWWTLIIIFYFTGLLLEEGAYFTNGKILCHISFFVYTFWRLLWFSQILNMTIQDFLNIHSYHKITEPFEFRLFWKLSKNISFCRN